LVRLGKWRFSFECPVHKQVTLVEIEAQTEYEARMLLFGRQIQCQFGGRYGAHTFKAEQATFKGSKSLTEMRQELEAERFSRMVAMPEALKEETDWERGGEVFDLGHGKPRTAIAGPGTGVKPLGSLRLVRGEIVEALPPVKRWRATLRKPVMLLPERFVLQPKGELKDTIDVSAENEGEARRKILEAHPTAEIKFLQFTGTQQLKSLFTTVFFEKELKRAPPGYKKDLVLVPKVNVLGVLEAKYVEPKPETVGYVRYKRFLTTKFLNEARSIARGRAAYVKAPLYKRKTRLLPIQETSPQARGIIYLVRHQPGLSVKEIGQLLDISYWNAFRIIASMLSLVESYPRTRGEPWTMIYTYPNLTSQQRVMNEIQRRLEEPDSAADLRREVGVSSASDTEVFNAVLTKLKSEFGKRKAEFTFGDEWHQNVTVWPAGGLLSADELADDWMELASLEGWLATPEEEKEIQAQLKRAEEARKRGSLSFYA